MKIEDIYSFFKAPPPFFLNNELAVCYVAAVLVHESSYGTELLQRLAADYPGCRLSDTVLYGGLKFLVEEDMITSYLQKGEGRGRPRRIYQIQAGAEERVKALSQLWHEYSVRFLNINSKLPASQRIRGSLREYSWS